MGYYTDYHVEIKNIRNQHEADSIEFLYNEDMIGYKKGDYPNLCFYASNLKWYDWQKDFEEFSKIYYPHVVFDIVGDGEEKGDIWKARVINGQTEFVKAKIVFEDFVALEEFPEIPKPQGWALFIDDECEPANDGWEYVIARSSSDALDMLKENEAPVWISFDHDLGGDDTAMEFCRGLVDHLISNGQKLPKEFDFQVHSQNPIGVEDITAYMKNVIKVFGQ